MAYWLAKTEPDTYNFAQFLKDRKTHWDGVRNFQARNFLREMKVGDLVLIYHSGKDKAVMGIAKVAKAAFADPDPEQPGDWVQVGLAVDVAFVTPVTLSTIKSEARLKTLPLIKQSRLSVMPIKAAEYEYLVKLGSSVSAS